MFLCKNQTGNPFCDYSVKDKPRQCNFEKRTGGSFLDCPYIKEIEDLKPCPFCGGKAKLYYSNACSTWSVRCEENGCCVTNLLELSKEQAVNLWNGRAPIKQKRS